MDLSAVLLVLSLAQIPGYALLGYKLYSTGLWSVYRYLTAFAVFDLIRVVVAAILPRDTDAYGYFFFATQPVVGLFYALMTLEVYQAVFRTQRGIAAFSRRVISVAVAISIVLAMSTLFLKSDTDSPYLLLESYLALERAIDFSLLCFVLLLIGFLMWYPVPLARNALVHSAIFSVFFGVKALALLARTLVGPEVTLLASLAVLSVSLVSLTLWFVLLTAAGEEVRVRAGYARSGIDEERLLQQLENINRTLLRSAKE
jgi:hypothetical protein